MSKKKDITGNIAEPLLPLAVPLASVNLDPNNARVHTSRNISALKNSLHKFGQRKPIVVNKRTGLIEAGNGTYVAASDLGWSHIAAVLVDDDPEQAVGYALTDNRSAELAEWDNDALTKLVRELNEQESLGLVFGFNEEELAAMLDELDEDPDAGGQGTGAHRVPNPLVGRDGAGAPGKPPSAPTAAVVQLFISPPERKEEFVRNCQALAKAWGTDNVTDTVLKAVQKIVDLGEHGEGGPIPE